MSLWDLSLIDSLKEYLLSGIEIKVLLLYFKNVVSHLAIYFYGLKQICKIEVIEFVIIGLLVDSFWIIGSKSLRE